MARIPMVTRTIQSTTATVLTVDVSTQKTEQATFVLPRTYESNDKALKVAKKMYETDTLKVVAILNLEVTEQLYGMTEAEFVELARVMDSRTATADTAEQESEE